MKLYDAVTFHQEERGGGNVDLGVSVRMSKQVIFPSRLMLYDVLHSRLYQSRKFMGGGDC